ncbi:MAG: cytochrome c [Ignavibacteria bacterium]|nr:cytochrome c [Ignavibacteria bacterium]
MTKAQIWVAGFLAAFILLLVLQNFTTTENSHSAGMGGMQQMAAGPANNPSVGGKELLTNFNCVTCHGADLKGTNLAPGLYGLKGTYSSQMLVSYLKNPQSFEGGARYKALKEKYSNRVMPSFGNRDDKDLEAIATYLLSLE